MRRARFSPLRAVAVFCVSVALTLSKVALAQTPPGLPALPPGVVPQQDPAQRLLDEQRSRDLQRELDRQPAQIDVAPSASPQVPDLPADADVETLPDPEPTFRIDHIVYKGDAVLSQSQLDRISAPFLNKSLGRRRIDLLLRRLTEAFVAHGLITTRAYLATPQNLSSGTLAITLVAGRISGFTLNGGALRPASDGAGGEGGGLITDAGTAWAFPISVGDVLNLPALEQGVDQINRLRRNQAQIQILPGQAPGESVIAIQNPFGSRLNYNVGIDNYGSTATGKWRTRASVEAGNVIGLQESLSLSYTGTRDSNALIVSTAVPYGYQTFSYTAALSEYQQIIGGTALLFGRTLSQIFGWNNVLRRSSTGRVSLDATLTHLSTERDVNDIPLTPQDLTILRVGISGLWRFTRGGQPGAVTASLGVSQGLPWLDATRDFDGIQKQDAHAQFTKIDASTTVQMLLAQIGPTYWTWRSTLTGQYSAVALFGNAQIFLGGMDSVRGFMQGGIAGDSGFYARNEVVWANAPVWQGLRWEPYLFLDGGKAHLVAEAGWPTLIGAGAGVRAQWQFRGQTFSGELLAGRALVQPSSLGPKGSVVLVTLNWAG
ncbi:ShlB/FhaC/HecB family hemolysin secretion/activation protein [Pandoraea fibrosis]|uniref:Peptide transporter n=1 Tax=Pandoraea fibrosis TaxID=1891094 RepID=A0A5E4XVL7_9BURK|nr:ShlB/FhaC/HecB family hemolysin secretion/activation protein [Pandoraea fibrosis]VVE40511.1 peptide transporter [Pandoraea fibrosis]